MAIMPAGVHAAFILALEGNPRLLANRQGIHIDTQCDTRIIAIAQRAQFPCFCHWVPVANPQFIQLLPHKLAGFDLLKSKFRMLMKFTADIHNPIANGFSFLQELSNLHGIALLVKFVTYSRPTPPPFSVFARTVVWELPRTL